MVIKLNGLLAYYNRDVVNAVHGRRSRATTEGQEARIATNEMAMPTWIGRVSKHIGA